MAATPLSLTAQQQFAATSSFVLFLFAYSPSLVGWLMQKAAVYHLVILAELSILLIINSLLCLPVVKAVRA